MWILLASLLVSACGSAHTSKGPNKFQMTHPNIVQNPTGKPDAWYRPSPIRVHVGQRVVWTNKDSDPHDVTANDGVFASGPIPAGGTYQLVTSRPGTYRYFCTIHPGMHGVIIVER